MGLASTDPDTDLYRCCIVFKNGSTLNCRMSRTTVDKVTKDFLAGAQSAVYDTAPDFTKGVPKVLLRFEDVLYIH